MSDVIKLSGNFHEPRLIVENKIFVQGVQLEYINEKNMEKLFEACGYDEMGFKVVSFVKVKNDVAYFKQISYGDGEIYVGYILLDLKKGLVDVEANCEWFSIEDNEEGLAHSRYASLDGKEI